MDTRLKRSVLKGVLASLGFVGAIAFAATFNLFQPATGILVGNSSTYITSAAAWSNIQSLLSGTCNSTVFVRGDGACTAVPAGVVPGGANTNVQYNSSGAFAGNSGFTYDGSGNISLTGRVSATGLNNQFGTTSTGSFGAVLNVSSDTSHYSLHEATDGNGNQIALGVNNSGSTQVGLPTGTVGVGTTSVLPLHIATAGHGIFLDDNTTFSSGVVVGAPTGGNKGAGTLNAVGLYVGGVAVGTGGGGTPGGSSGQLQWNSGGTFGGVGGSTFTSATQQLELIPSAGNITALKATSNGTNDVEIVASNAAGADAYFRAVDLSGTNWSFGNQRSTSAFIIANGVGLSSNPALTLTTSNANFSESIQAKSPTSAQISAVANGATNFGQIIAIANSGISGAICVSDTVNVCDASVGAGVVDFRAGVGGTSSGMQFTVNGRVVKTVTAGGTWSIPAPSSGSTLTLAGVSGGVSPALLVNGTAGSAVVELNSGLSLALNSVGTDFGFIQNDTSNKWSLAHGTSLTALGTDTLSWFASGGVVIGAPTGGDPGGGNLNVQGVVFQAGIPIVTTGTQTCTLSGGLVSNPTMTCTTVQTDDGSGHGEYCINVNNTSGTSNASTNLTVTAGTSFKAMRANGSATFISVLDNGVEGLGCANKIVANSFQISKTDCSGASGFTASGTKGIARSFNLCYAY